MNHTHQDLDEKAVFKPYKVVFKETSKEYTIYFSPKDEQLVRNILKTMGVKGEGIDFNIEKGMITTYEKSIMKSITDAFDEEDLYFSNYSMR